jgi:predicted metal-dependent phosphoesterase TrpH
MAVAAGLELLDLHNHTHRSYDASNRLADYERAYLAGRFDVLAVTDHNRLDGALELARDASFPVIAGMEIDTSDGELIGLFLSEPIRPGLDGAETAVRIRSQGGLVYLQHPFYPLVRRPLCAAVLLGLAERGLIDVVEGRNGGPFTGRSVVRARAWADRWGIPVGAGSDAHDPPDIGQCVVGVPPGPLEPASVLERLGRGVLVDRRRNSVLQIATKGRHRVAGAISRSARGEPRASRLP